MLVRTGVEYRERFARWWSPETDGPLLQFEWTIPGAAAAPPAWAGHPDPWWYLMHWLMGPGRMGDADPGPLLEYWDGWLAGRGRSRDVVPQLWLNFGPGSLAAYLTGRLDFRTNTSWFELPEPMPWDEIMTLTVSDDNPWWVATRRLARDLAARRSDRYEIGMADLGGVTDVLASLRTTPQLLEDCLTDPDLVLEASRRLLKPWHACWDELDRILRANGQAGRAAWMGLWSADRWYPFQCDFCAMLSPAHFDRLVAPILAEQFRAARDATYHWDGPGQIPHLDSLLAIPNLKAIQWVPGASAPGAGDPRWRPLYRRIQAKGIRLILNNGVTPGDVPGLLADLDPKGLLIACGCRDEREARSLAGMIAP